MDKDFSKGNIFTGSPELQKALSNIDLKTLSSNINLPNASMSKPNHGEEIRNTLIETQKKKAQYEAELLNTLKSIEQNTANLSEIVGLIQSSNSQQEEMLGLLSEIMSIAKASNKEEAEDMWKKIMTKITTTADDVDSINKLIGFGTVVYNQVIQNMDTINKGIDFVADKLKI